MTSEPKPQEIAYKNNHGLIEVYGLSSDPDNHAYAREDATRIGLYVQENRKDSRPMRSAALPMSPKLAREIAAQLVRWADQIES